MNGAKNAKKDFLGKIQRLVAIAQQADGELYDHPLVLGHQLDASRFFARRTPLYQRPLAATDVGPADDTGVLHRKVPKRSGHRADQSPLYRILTPE